jgi:hypothetical protein
MQQKVPRDIWWSSSAPSTGGVSTLVLEDWGSPHPARLVTCSSTSSSELDTELKAHRNCRTPCSQIQIVPTKWSGSGPAGDLPTNLTQTCHIASELTKGCSYNICHNLQFTYSSLCCCGVAPLVLVWSAGHLLQQCDLWISGTIAVPEWTNSQISVSTALLKAAHAERSP